MVYCNFLHLTGIFLLKFALLISCFVYFFLKENIYIATCKNGLKLFYVFFFLLLLFSFFRLFISSKKS